jgi:hypothetical protein
VIVPDALATPTGVVVGPGIPIRVNAGLTTASARQAADRSCDDFPECEPIVVSREELPAGGVLTRWDDASRTITDLEVTTWDFGQWTLVMSEPDPALAERIARALSWSGDEDGYPHLAGDVTLYYSFACLRCLVEQRRWAEAEYLCALRPSGLRLPTWSANWKRIRS